MGTCGTRFEAGSLKSSYMKCQEEGDLLKTETIMAGRLFQNMNMTYNPDLARVKQDSSLLPIPSPGDVR